MQIQIWSDIACPFCYIGKRHLEEALSSQPKGTANIDIVYRSFELDPNAPINSAKSIYTELADKYGMSLEDAKQMTKNVVHQAELAGLTFNFDTLIPTNTFDAHRLLHLAADHQLMEPMQERLFKAFFTESLDLSKPESLNQLAIDVGLPAGSLEKALSEQQYADSVRADEEMAKQLQINSVPFFVFDNKYAVSGAQPVQTFKEILQQIEHEGISSKDDNSGSCSGGACSI